MANPFTPEQISQILEEFFKVVGTRQYIGARYVPIFGRKGEESIEWDNSAPYEPLTIVLYQGNSYTSRQYVPVGVEITNQEFWAITGNYNAQVEQYRQEVAAFDKRIKANAASIANETTNRQNADIGITNVLNKEVEAFDKRIKANAASIANETTNRQNADIGITNVLNNIQPLDAAPTQGSTKGVTSGGVYTAVKSVIDDIDEIPDYIYHTGIKVLVFGDSTFITNPPSVVQQIPKLDESINLVRYAIGGTTYAQISTQISNAQAAGDMTTADYIIVASGTNNWQGRKKLVSVAQGDCAFIDDVRTICQLISQSAPQAQVLLVGAGWASNASYTGQIYLNDCGCSISAYNDIIEGVAGEFHFGYLGLDRLLSINEYNYRSKMITSNSDGTHPEWNGIYVHYSPATSARIARAILANIYGINGNTAPASFIDITPPHWTYGKADYFYHAGYMNVVSSGNMDVENLLPNKTYWITCFGGATTFTVNGTVAASSSIQQGIMQFPVTTDDNGKLAITMTGTIATAKAPMLTIGRPSVLSLRTNRTFTPSGGNAGALAFGNACFIAGTPIGFNEFPSTVNYNTKLFDLPGDAQIINGIGFINFAISGENYYSLGGRCENGGFYLSETPSGLALAGKKVTNVQYFVQGRLV